MEYLQIGNDWFEKISSLEYKEVDSGKKWSSGQIKALMTTTGFEAKWRKFLPPREERSSVKYKYWKEGEKIMSFKEYLEESLSSHIINQISKILTNELHIKGVTAQDLLIGGIELSAQRIYDEIIKNISNQSMKKDISPWRSH